MQESLFYKEINNEVILCHLCPHLCHLKNNEVGRCGVRKHVDKKLYSLNYGKVSAIQIDPIEKKPLFRFMPNTQTLSIGSFGCNLACGFCQNHHIAKALPPTREMKPKEIVELALHHKTPSISYTYNEPIIYYEYMLETAKLAKKNQLNNIMVTNGYITEEPLRAILPYIDAMNIDLKSFKNSTYETQCKGRLEPVMRTIEVASKSCHVEVTTLVVTDMNDEKEELISLFRWLASIGEKIPLHISRYFPRYMYDKPPTSIDMLKDIKIEAAKYLEYVYLGNVHK